MGFSKGFANIFKDMSTAKSVAKDWMGKANRLATNRNLMIGAAAGAGIFAASRLSNNSYIRGAGDVAGMAALGMGGWAGGRMAMNRYGGPAAASAGPSRVTGDIRNKVNMFRGESRVSGPMGGVSGPAGPNSFTLRGSRTLNL